MNNTEKQESVKSFKQLLKKRLISLTLLKPENPRFQYFLEYDIRAVERGQMAVANLQKADVKVKEASLLDIGCGTGGFSVAFALGGARVIGLDIDKSALPLAVLRARNEEAPIDFICCDATHTPFRDSHFEIIVCNEVFEHVDSKEKLVYEIARLLKRNGAAYIRVPNKASPWNILSDDHTGLPFFTLLPRSVQDFIIRITGLSPTGMPCALDEPTYGSLKKIFNQIGMDLKDEAMRESITKSVFLLNKDLLVKSRSNRYPQLANTSLRILKMTYDICKLVRVSDLWWFVILRTYPILTFVGVKRTSNPSLSD